MSKISTAHYRKLVRVFERKGFIFDRQEGDHLIYVRTDIKRPICHSDVQIGAGLYHLEQLKNCWYFPERILITLVAQVFRIFRLRRTRPLAGVSSS